MNDTRTFTIFLPRELASEDDVVVARKLSGPDAIKKAIELDGAWTAHLHEDDFERFRLYRWEPHATKWPDDKRRRDTLCATVVKSADRVRDHIAGVSMIVDQFIRQSGHYGKSRIVTDDEFDKRLVHVAKRREVHRLDRVVATALVDALLAHGYDITDASDEEFERSKDRELILDLLLDVERIELFVGRGEDQSWMRLIFGENGWDLVQDYSVDLGYLIDAIVEPLLPWKRNRTDRNVAIEASMPDPVEERSTTGKAPK